MTTNTMRTLTSGLALAALVACAAPAQAQLNGENLLGDMGVKSATQPAPGVYVSNIYYRYRADSIKDGNGNTVPFDPSGTGSQTINAAVPVVNWITKAKLFGANFGMMAVVPFAKGALEAPGLGLSEKASAGVSDLYVMPAQLGWHYDRVDAIAGVAFFAPTGRYEAGASDNLGKGMWSYEVSGGATAYFDRDRTLSASTTVFWETHGKKEGTVAVDTVTLTDVKVGNLVTLEGGLAKSFLHGGAHVGMAYYAQWKVSADQFDVVPGAARVGVPEKHRVFGIGPDVTIPIGTKTKLISLVNVRYLWEQGTELKTQGHTFIVTNTIPIGGMTRGRK